MEIGFIGLGKMGSYMVERLLRGKHKVIAFDIDKKARRRVKEKGADTAHSIGNLVLRLKPPCAVWVMVPAGRPIDETIALLASILRAGDIVIDGGNSNYKDTMRRADRLKEKGIFMLDAGTSGGTWGLKTGYCLMVGGEEKVFRRLKPIFRTLAPKDGYAYVGRNGAGHFVKMVHNGIEYAMLEAYAEGFEVIKQKKEFDLDLATISHLWNRGSVIRSWLLELAESAFKKDPRLKKIKGFVADSGEGRWTVAEAINENVPVPVITLSLLQRLRSRQGESFSAKVIAALRNEFGGHSVKSVKITA